MISRFQYLVVVVRNFLGQEDGQDLIEYGLLVALLSLAAVAGVGKVATAVTTFFTNISTTLA